MVREVLGQRLTAIYVYVSGSRGALVAVYYNVGVVNEFATQRESVGGGRVGNPTAYACIETT